MRIVSLHCPNCNGQIRIDADKTSDNRFCNYCGQQILISDEIQRSEHKETIIDQAKVQKHIAKAETEKYKYERRKSTNKLLALIVGGILILILLFAFTP